MSESESNDDRPNPNVNWSGPPVPRQPETPEIDQSKLPKIYPMIKRVLEFPVALVVAVLMSPIFILVAIGAYISHGAPALFSFPRMGKRGKDFGVYKFRTMLVGAKEQQAKGVPYDQLVTKYGQFLRKTHLDETAQILNVLFGHISFVGPRPIDRDYYQSLLGQNVIWEDLQLTRPGITCLESVFADLPEHEEKLRKLFKVPPAPTRRVTVSLPRRYPLDRFYIENESLWLDIVIVWYTLKTLAGRAAPYRG